MRSWLVTLLLTVTLAQLGLSGPVQNPREEEKPLEWWQRAVVYQIYPRSFKDSDGDGVGDINGITSMLDYFVELGIEAIWISPIYKSPMVDFGYDISDFRDIDPIFGTLDDFKRMAVEFHKRDIKLVMDLVPNHSSDLHEWFNKSVQRIEPFTNFYVWRDANGTDENGKPKPPNNWVSVFSGSAWEWNEQRGQFYLHQFAKEQPDLNFEISDVRHEMLAIVKFWLDLGVDGFRVDAVPHMFEDQRFLDEPKNEGCQPDCQPDEHRYWLHPYTFDLPQVLDWLASMRKLVDAYSLKDGRVRCMMVEATVGDDSIMNYYGTANRPIAHFPFNFQLLGVRENQDTGYIRQLMDFWYSHMPEGEWPTTLIGNHDNKRAAYRWTPEGVDGANMVNLLRRGTAVTFNGEELGMTDTFLTWEETQDPAACNTDPERYQDFSRDPARTPFHWNNETGAGFSSNEKTWLPLNPNYKTVNLRAEKEAAESHYKLYKELLEMRKSVAWRHGNYQSASFNNDRVLAFTQIPPAEYAASGYMVLVNFSNDTVTVDSSGFNKVPSVGTVRLRSVGYHGRDIVIGGSVDTNSINMGHRDSVVIEFNPVY